MTGDRTMESPALGWAIIAYALALAAAAIVPVAVFVELGDGWLLLAAAAMVATSLVLVAAGFYELVEAENLGVLMRRHRSVMRKAGLDE